jgi:hypothetical protein
LFLRGKALLYNGTTEQAMKHLEEALRTVSTPFFFSWNIFSLHALSATEQILKHLEAFRTVHVFFFPLAFSPLSFQLLMCEVLSY